MERDDDFQREFGRYRHEARVLIAELSKAVKQGGHGELNSARFFEAGDGLLATVLGPRSNLIDEDAAATVLAMVGIDLLITSSAAALAAMHGDVLMPLTDLPSVLPAETVHAAEATIQERRKRAITHDELELVVGESRQMVTKLLTAIVEGVDGFQESVGGDASTGPGAMTAITTDDIVQKIVDRTADDLSGVAAAMTAPFMQGLAPYASDLVSLALNVSIPGKGFLMTAGMGVSAAARKLRKLIEHIQGILPDEIPKWVGDLASYAGGRFGRDILKRPLWWDAVRESVNQQLVQSGNSRANAVSKALGRVNDKHWWLRSWVPVATMGLPFLVVTHFPIAIGASALLVLVDLLEARDVLDAPGFPDLFVGVRRAVGRTLGEPPAEV